MGTKYICFAVSIIPISPSASFSLLSAASAAGLQTQLSSCCVPGHGINVFFIINIIIVMQKLEKGGCSHCFWIKKTCSVRGLWEGAKYQFVAKTCHPGPPRDGWFTRQTSPPNVFDISVVLKRTRSPTCVVRPDVWGTSAWSLWMSFSCLVTWCLCCRLLSHAHCSEEHGGREEASSPQALPSTTLFLGVTSSSSIFPLKAGRPEVISSALQTGQQALSNSSPSK